MVWIAGCWDSSNILLTSHLPWKVVDFPAFFGAWVVEKEGSLHAHVSNNKVIGDWRYFFI
jgi:hypothetical protein